MTNILANIVAVIVGASYPDVEFTGWRIILIMYAFLIVLGLLNMYAFWLIPWIELMAGLLHVVLWLVYAVVLLTLSTRHSSSFVWLEKANLSGWDNDFVSFNLGMILITWSFVGFDAVAHISEVRFRAVSLSRILEINMLVGNTQGPLLHSPCYVLVDLHERQLGIWHDPDLPLLGRQH